MSTVRERIVAAAMTALNTGRPAGVPEFIRTRIDSPSADQLPVCTVYQGNEGVMAAHDTGQGTRSVVTRGPVVRRSLVLQVEVLTKAGTDTEPDKAADPMLAWAAQSLAAAGKLAGLADYPADEMGTKFDYEQGETSFCRSTIGFEIKYHSRTDNPELLS